MPNTFVKDDIEAVRRSEFFDEAWYLEQFPDVSVMMMDAAEHFCWVGWRMGRNPSPAFSVQAYLDRYKDVAAADLNPLLHYIRFGKAEGRNAIPAEILALPMLEGADDIEFSVIMPTRDRAHCIKAAIDSLLAQAHMKFELVIVDDGSTDDTEELVKNSYSVELGEGRIIYVRSVESVGVCAARNIGLSKSTKPWIAYLDSDNTVRPEFLENFVQGILRNPKSKAFYANFQVNGSDKIAGRPFDLKELGRKNFIDIGVFCHHRECYKVLGGFDPKLKRLVDWELIYRFAKKYRPVHLPYAVMDYCNRDAAERISRSESYAQARVQVHRKHRFRPTVSVIILSYNQQDYILKALESVVRQAGWLTFEVIISDDGSTDRTPEIIRDFCTKHKHLTRNISSEFNIGISANFKKCFEAASGEYIAVLEGDDYWESRDNLAKKVAFLKKHADCSMVFSKTQMLFESEEKREIQLLDRQERLTTNKLTGQDFMNDPSMNLIVNFSSCMFRTDLMKAMPYEAYTLRLSEITVAFYLERFGPLGYIDEPLTVYRHHGSGTWSGLNYRQQLINAMQIREIVKSMAAPKYHKAIDAVIKNKYVKRLEEFDRKTRSKSEI